MKYSLYEYCFAFSLLYCKIMGERCVQVFIRFNAFIKQSLKMDIPCNTNLYPQMLETDMPNFYFLWEDP